jgi:hypothetical protein
MDTAQQLLTGKYEPVAHTQKITSSSAEGELLVAPVSDEVVKSIVSEMDHNGFGVLPNYLRSTDLQLLQSFVKGAVDNAGGEYVGFTGKNAVAGTILAKLSDSPEFQNLLRKVYEFGSGQAPPTQSLYQVLRCLKGSSGVRHSLIFHFDSYLVTALVPIIIPSEGKAGHLVMLPNVRRVRRFYWQNLLDKLFLDNKITQRILRRAFETNRLGLKPVQMTPGSLYFFWGYRTVHANEACDPDNIRATALFHFGDPHTNSALRKLTGRAAVRAATSN